jgi:hypothetical protein
LLLLLLLVLLVVLLLKQAPLQPSHPATAHEGQQQQEMTTETNDTSRMALTGSEGTSQGRAHGVRCAGFNWPMCTSLCPHLFWLLWGSTSCRNGYMDAYCLTRGAADILQSFYFEQAQVAGHEPRPEDNG